MSHNRLSRQDIKRDEVMEGLSRVAAFLRDHARTLAIGLALVFAVLAAIVIWQTIAAGREVKANDMLAAALEGAETSEDGVAGAKDRFVEVVEAYGSTRAGAIAYAYLGTLAAEEEDYGQARGHWDRVLDRHPDDAMAAAVERNLISLDRAEGKHEELAQRLRDALATGSSALGADTVLLELGATLEELGQVEGAREAYDRLLDEHPTSSHATRARERTAALDA
jgi:tetratricopeptide (TPR) repeat protein